MSETLSALKDKIEGFNSAQEGLFNQNCDSKIYDESSQTMTGTEEDEALTAADDVNGLSTSELGELRTMLSSSKKLTFRPC